MQRDDLIMWLMTGYLLVLNLVFAFVAWTLWIWRDGLLTPEETAGIMMGPLMTLGPLAVLLDLALGAAFIRWLKRAPKGGSSSSATE